MPVFLRLKPWVMKLVVVDGQLNVFYGSQIVLGAECNSGG
jgi:hypothetical protein